MKIAETCIRRPVFAIVINLLVLLFGIISYERLTVREYPNIDVPVVTVETTYPGASARIIETQVTKPIEDTLSGIEGIDFIRSISRSEQSQITVQFKLDRDSDAAASDVRDRVGRARKLLPEDIDEPIVTKVEADAQPIMWLSLSSTEHSSLDVSEYADIVVQDRLQTIPGVATVNLFAQRRYSMRIWLDRDRLAAYQLTAADVEDALRAQNVEIPAGRIESVEREFTVLTETDLNLPSEFEQIVLKTSDSGALVRMKDVARVELGPEEERQVARFNNRTTIALGIVKQSIANPLEISDDIQKVLPEIEKTLPKGMKLQVAFNSSIFIRESINSVYHTIIEATVLVVLVIFFFLRTIRATLIPLVTIPISLIGAMAMMYAFGFSINTLTLLAMVIAIGLVVDDAIVVLENVFRHIEEGMDRVHAAVKAMREIGFAVIAMTLTLAAVFAPVAFTPGRTGQLFVEFALTLAGSVIVSGFIAITLTPMMCSRMLKANHNEPAWSKRIEGILQKLETKYREKLNWSLGYRLYIVAGSIIIFLCSALIFSFTSSELSPPEDRGIIYGSGIAPEGATIDYSDKYAKQMEKIMQSVPEYKWNFMAVGFPFITQSFTVLGLSDWSDRDRSSFEIIEEIGPKLMSIPGTLNFPINPASLGQRGNSKPVEFVIQTTKSYAELDQLVSQVMAKATQNPGLRAPDSDLRLNKPELRVDVNRDKLATMGVRVDDIGRTLETMLAGRDVTRFKRNGEQYDVIVKIEDDLRRAPNDLESIYVRGRNNEMVQLSNVVTLEENVAPRELNHFNKLRAATISSVLAPGYTVGDALEFLEQTVREIDPTASIDYSGVSREFKESSSSLGFIFILALLFIYLVLAGQFESFRDPIIILLSVPLAMFGALFFMMLTGGTLNVYSQIGLVALIGLISKHGILIVEFANQLQERGYTIRDAVVESAAIRLRPILMTTGAMVLGLFPLAFASGAGAEAREAIGVVMVGGMAFGTLFTLFVVPTFYLLLSSPRHLITIDESKLVEKTPGN